MMWEIENKDEAGEGVFFVDAPSAEEALEIYRQHEKAEVISVQQMLWSSLALKDGELGSGYIYKAQEKSES